MQNKSGFSLSLILRRNSRASARGMNAFLRFLLRRKLRTLVRGASLLILTFLIPSAFSQENITITTYYPSPAGVYSELLVSNRMAVGDTNGDGVVNGLDLPTDAAGNPLNNTLATVNSLNNRMAVGDVNGDGAINGGDLGQDAAGNPRNGTLTVANAFGIGTINPQGELHVRSTDNTNGNANLILEGENPATGASTGTWDISALGSTAGANAGNLQFNTTNAAGNTTTPMTISSGAPDNSIFIAPNGNVGIGTNNPQATLDINTQNGSVPGFILQRVNNQQMNALPHIEGLLVYNTDTHSLMVYNGNAWTPVGAQTTWVPCWYDLGEVSYTQNVVVPYNVPAAIPASASEILVYMQYHHGDNGNAQTLGDYQVYTKDGGTLYSFYMHVDAGHSQAGFWTSSSELEWLPLTSERRVYAKQTFLTITGNKWGRVYIVGYR